MLYLPLPVAPDRAAARTEASIGLAEFELPDARRAQIVRLEGWIPVQSNQFTRLSMDYVGLESEDLFRYGGGRLEVQWSAHYEDAWPAALGLDLALTVPVGDASLHPLSAKAPALRARLRGRVAGGSQWYVWVGAWSRTVSPPENSVREAPRGVFPSASGFDLAVRLRGAGWGFDGAVRTPVFGGAPSETTVDLALRRHLTEALAAELGGAVSLGPEDDRMFDHMASLSLIWTPKLRARDHTDDRDRRR